MDVALSIVTGLGLRLFLTGINDALAPVLIGIWEGAFINQLSNNLSGGSPAVDHYLAYGLRLVVDVLFTGNVRRMVLIFLWTTLGMIASEVATVNLIHDEKRERRHKHSRSLPSHVRAYETPVIAIPDTLSQPQPQVVANTPPFLTQQVNTERHLDSHQFPVSRPPSPPSFFLQDNTEIFSPSPKPVQLQFLPSSQSSPLHRPRSGLASFLEESGSPLPKHVLPPSPPESAVPDASAALESEPRRLTPIQELSVEDLTNPSGSRSPESTPLIYHVAQPTSRYNDQFEPAYAPSSSTAAIPIPNPHASQSRQTSSDDLNDANYTPSTPTAAPLPVLLSRAHYPTWVAITTSEPDELRTPGQPDWGLAADTDHDELQTPIALALHPTELSPLMLDEELGTEPEPQPFMIPIPIPIPEPVPVPIDEEPPPTSFTDFALLQPPVPSSALLAPPAALPPTTRSHPDPALFSPASEAESIVSTGLADRLFSRAEALRKRARDEEEVRIKLKNEHEKALQEKRIKDALFLRGQIEESEELASKLHRKAERRFIIGTFYNLDLNICVLI